MERKFQFSVGEFYHIYNRGVDKRRIFEDENDYMRFQELLYLANGDRPVVYKTIQGLPLEWDRGSARSSILAYALMSNHFHLVVKEEIEGGISKFMSKLATSYSMYFNTRHTRSGALMNHPFRARHIDDDKYFRWAMSYVHMNPVPDTHIKQGNIQAATDHLRSFRFSSYPDYFVAERPASRILNVDSLPIPRADIESVSTMLNEISNNSTFQG